MRAQRITHGRMKPKAGARPTPDERSHMDRVAALPCLLYGLNIPFDQRCLGFTTLHHVTSDGFKRISRSHKTVVPLCEKHHLIQHGPRGSVEALGHRGFTLLYGIDLLGEANRLWAERG